MKKILLIGIALVSGIFLSNAQPAEKQAESLAHRVFISFHGGAALDIFENAFSYGENGRNSDLITHQGGLALGYNFSDAYSIRLSGAYGSDAGACNTRETSAHGFYPYSFKHINAFVDGIINLNGLAGNVTYFRPKLYAGVGGARTFGFTDSGHPWQKVIPKNNAIGFRLGAIIEYDFQSGFGLFADLCGEGWSDNYNGLKPSDIDKESTTGYPGFPLDLRGCVSLGLTYNF